MQSLQHQHSASSINNCKDEANGKMISDPSIMEGLRIFLGSPSLIQHLITSEWRVLLKRFFLMNSLCHSLPIWRCSDFKYNNEVVTRIARQSLSLSPDEKLLAYPTINETIKICEPATDRCVCSLPGGKVISTTFHGDILATVLHESILIWDLKSNNELFSISNRHGLGVEYHLVLEDYWLIYEKFGHTSQIHVWDLDKKIQLDNFPGTDPVYLLDNKLAYIYNHPLPGTYTHSLVIRDLTTSQERILYISDSGSIHSIMASPDKRLVLILLGHKCQLVAVSSAEVLHTIMGDIDCIQISSDNKLLASLSETDVQGGRQHTKRLWQRYSGQELVHVGQFNAKFPQCKWPRGYEGLIQFHPRDRLIATLVNEGLALYDYNCCHLFTKMLPGITGFFFSRSGKRLVIHTDKEIEVYQLYSLEDVWFSPHQVLFLYLLYRLRPVRKVNLQSIQQTLALNNISEREFSLQLIYNSFSPEWQALLRDVLHIT